MKQAVVTSILLIAIVLVPATATPAGIEETDFITLDDMQFLPTLASELSCRPSVVIAVCFMVSLEYWWSTPEEGDPSWTTDATVGFQWLYTGENEGLNVQLAVAPQQLVYPKDWVYIRATGTTTIPEAWDGTEFSTEIALTRIGNVYFPAPTAGPSCSRTLHLKARDS